MGTLNNLYRWTQDQQYRLLPDYDTPSTLTRDQIDGVEGWPFGPIEGYLPGVVVENTDTAEYVYRATATNTAPATPTGGDDTDDFVPTDWSADAPAPTIALPYVWRSTRTQSGGDWEDDDFAAPELWAYVLPMSETDSTWYETEVIDLGETSNVDVTMDIEPRDPVAGVVTRADIETGRVVVAAGTDIELYDANGATATGSLTSAAGTLDLTGDLTIAEIRYDSTNSKIRFDRGTSDTDDFDDWADENQGLALYVEVGGTVEELPVEDVAASGDAYVEWDISSDFKTALDNQTADDRLLLMVAEADQKPLAIVIPEDGHDFYLYHATGTTEPARSTFTQAAISGLTRVNGVRYIAARVHLKKWKGLGLERFSPEIRRIQ